MENDNKYYKLREINVTDEYTYKLKEITDDQIMILKKLNISGFMLAGRLMRLGKKKLEELEKEETDFAIQNFDCECSLVFRFIDGEIKLVSIAEIVKKGSKNIKKILLKD